MTRLQKRDVLMSIYSLSDCKKLFALTAEDLQAHILHMHSGLSSFNAEMLFKHKHQIISCDPLYCLSVDALRQHTDFELGDSPVIDEFFKDYVKGREQGRYRLDDLSLLSDHHIRFDIILCGQSFLFDHERKSLNFYIDKLLSLVEIAADIRIAPFFDKDGRLLQWLGPFIAALQEEGMRVELRQVSYHHQLTALFRVWSQSCRWEK